jgi:site-specific DNA recombinase
MIRRAALYARVSTARQEQEQTVGSQLAALKAAAAAAEVLLADEHHYVDEGYSGSRLDRPALDRLRDAAAEGLLDVVFVHCLDRLARNFVHQQILVEELQKRGVDVHFVERPIGERPEDRLLMQMQGVIAEYERAKILERTRRGKLHKVKTGQLLPFTSAPYGYEIVRTPEAPKGAVVIDEVQAEHVRAMFRWACDDELSVSAIARRLNALGVAPRHARRWSTTTIWRMLTNPVYAGRAYYGKSEVVEPRKSKLGTYRKAIKSSTARKPRELWHEQRVPAIVDDARVKQATEAMARRRRLASRNIKHDYLLRMLVTCGHCGLRMAASCADFGAGKPRYFYYVCNGRKQTAETGRATRCTAPSIRSEQLDAVAWDALVGWIKSPQMLREQVATWKDARPSKAQCTADAQREEKTIRQLDAQIARLVDAYQLGAVTVDELKARRERLSSARDAAHLRLQQLRGDNLSHDRAESLADDIAAFAATLTDGIEALDFAGRQRLVRLLVERVVVKGDEVTVEHVVPLSGRFYGLHSPDRARRDDEKSRKRREFRWRRALWKFSAFASASVLTVLAPIHDSDR